MKRTIALVCLVLGINAAIAVPKPEKIQTAAEKVTLFIDGAQITRTKQVNIPAGNSTLVFTGLSPYLDEKSMQVSAKGDFTITSVNRIFNYTDSLERTTRQNELMQQIEQTASERLKVQARREVADAESEMLKINSSVGNRNVATSLAAIKELNEYYAARMQQLKNRQLELDRELEALLRKEQQLRAELEQLGGKRAIPMSEIEVRIESKTACKGNFTLTYYVRNAGWYPSYDVRSDGLTRPIAISYKANISQNTREDWKNVELTLSSSNPNTGNIAPQLRTYWLDYGLTAPLYNVNLASNTVSGVVMDDEREPLIGVNVMIPGTTVATNTDINGRYSITIPNGAEKLQFSYLGFVPQTLAIRGGTMNVTMKEDAQMLDEVVVLAYGTSKKSTRTGSAKAVKDENMAGRTPGVSRLMEVEQSQGRLGYEFQIMQPYTVPSDGKAVVAEIGRFELPAIYTYQSTPKIDKDAFLVAEATQWEKLNLLQGEANVYFENTFVGKSILDPNQVSDTLRFSMGRDRSIRIERSKQTDRISRRFIGSNQTQAMAWKFTVRNTRVEAVVLNLYDQLPVSRNSTITVTEEELSGGQLDKHSGIINWRLELEPGEQRELLLHYGVKYPKGRHLVIE